MMSNKQLNKPPKKSNRISEHCTVSERGFGDGMESYRPKQLDEHRGGGGWGYRRRRKVNKVHEGVKVQKSSRRQRMAAQLAVR